jgi:phosphoesterase RecJ-like protein
MEPIHGIYDQLKEKKRIAITMHQKPDADAMGSALALTHFLRQFDHEVFVISPTNWARWLDWMEGTADVYDYELERQEADKILDSVDWLFSLDHNHFSRAKHMAPKLASIQCTKILIDHHREPDEASFQYGVSNTGKVLPAK